MIAVVEKTVEEWLRDHKERIEALETGAGEVESLKKTLETIEQIVSGKAQLIDETVKETADLKAAFSELSDIVSSPSFQGGTTTETGEGVVLPGSPAPPEPPPEEPPEKEEPPEEPPEKEEAPEEPPEEEAEPDTIHVFLAEELK